MKYIITENQYRQIVENVDDILDKISNGEKLSSSDRRKLNFFQKHLSQGGNETNFKYSDQDDYGVDEREGKKFTYELNGKPLTFTFSEENMDGDKVEYFGEIRFDGDEFLGVIATDSRGYLTEYDFYSVFDENIRLQDILKEQGIDDETQNFFQEEIINSLKM
jgi:hypothetical protein